MRDIATLAKFATVQKEGGRDVELNIEYYNLDMVISVGYRVKSNEGVLFRRWANSILREYIVNGYARNDDRLKQLGNTIKIINRSAYKHLYNAIFKKNRVRS